MRVRLQAGYRPVRVKARRYPQDQRQFLDKYVETLKQMGFFIEMPTAEWQAAPLLVPKRGSKAKYRLAVDLRPVNAATTKEAWPMPHLDSEIYDFAGSSYFASIDFVSGYWQLPLHKDSFTACGVITPKGVLASTRVLPGLANATRYFQSTVEPLFSELRDHMKAWLDDFNLHAADESTLLDKLSRFFEICGEKRLYLSARKCRLFCKELKWCGRIITGEGYRLDPVKLSGLQDLHTPRSADELSQFVHCSRWMASAIPDLARRIKPLNDILEDAYTRVGRRTKRAIRKISISSLSWGPVHDRAFEDLQESLRHAITIAYPDPRKVTCIFTDASEKFWSCVITQTSPEQLKRAVTEQKHEPLGFLAGELKNSSANWTTFEKEGYAIVQAFGKMDYLLMGAPNVRVFTDHRNLLFVYAPLALEPSLGRHVVSKVQRWALYISRFRYVIEHVPGQQNVFADILTRWLRGYRKEERGLVCSMILDTAQQMVPSADSIPWPSIESMRSAQERQKRPEGLTFDEGDRLWKRDGLIWIPQGELELQLKLMVTSHCGTVGHRGQDTTLSILRETFWWPGMKVDVQAFVRGCLHCLVSRAGVVIPRLLGHALHAEKPNEVVHLDFLYMGTGIDWKKYILIIRDDLSSYTWLWPTDETTAEAAAEALLHWLGVFGSMDWVVTDQGSHFKNVLIKRLTDESRVHHHFTTAYCPWANGTVERVCREVLRACRALLSEWKLAQQDWPAVTEAFQSVLNNTPLKRLGPRHPEQPSVYRTPQEILTRHRPVRPLLRALPLSKYPDAQTNDKIRARQLVSTNSLQAALQDMRREVSVRVTQRREK